MTTKRTIRFWLMAVLMGGLSLGFAACSDDDDKPTEEQRVEQDLADAADFWNVVGQLTDGVMPDEGWQTATYAPSIGEADGTNSTVRIVQCADAENAAESFADLVGLTYGKDITADTPEYTYRNDLVGTLTYRRASGETLATVDVDIRQMPGLQQIVYRQVVDNASFAGTAYYRFGDVVSKQNADGQTDYWICVRPSFGIEGKGDSHWITLSKIPSENVKTVNKTVGGQRLTHIMPKSLCTNQEHMQNLAEMLYAILNPEQWAKNLKDNDGYKKLKYFQDFNYVKNFMYHNDAFFGNVADAWSNFNIYKNLFGLTADELRQELAANGLNLIYGTATMSSNNISLPLATFYQTNLKTKVLSKKTSTWDKQSFNIYDLTKNGYGEFKNFAGSNEKFWVVRYATGATLAKGSAETPIFDKYKKLPNCRDVYVYNADVANLDMDNLKNIAPAEAKKPSDPTEASNARNDGSGTYLIGDVVQDEQGNRWFCIAGSPFDPNFPFVTDHTAWFVTFDFNGINTSGPVVSGLPNEEDVPQLGAMIASFWGLITSFKIPYLFSPHNSDVSSSVIAKHIRDYADVDLNKVCLGLDSVWVFQSRGATYNSKSSSCIMNIAYNDGNSGKQAVCRIIYDLTKGGNCRNNCYGVSGTRYQDMYGRIYKHYEHYNPSVMRSLTEDEAGFGMTSWNLLWPMSTEKMYLQDVASQDMVNRHAKDDKWVTLPISDNPNVRRQPLTVAAVSAQPADFIGKYAPGDIQRTNIFNEPVSFLRVMKVTDSGGKKPNLVSQDGRRLTVVHLQNDGSAYFGHMQSLWAATYCMSSDQGLFTLDNQTYYAPIVPGWELVYPPK